MRNGKVREESVKIGSTYLEQEALERNLENEDYQKKKKKARDGEQREYPVQVTSKLTKQCSFSTSIRFLPGCAEAYKHFKSVTYGTKMAV